MDMQPLFGLPRLLSHIIGDIAQALCQRRDETHERQVARAQATAGSIAAFQPGDAVEVLIAGHCVMFHELIVDSVQTTLRGEQDTTRRATRSGIVAMDKAFGANLIRLEKYRARHAHGTEDATQADARAETEIADRVHRHQSGKTSTAPGTEAAQMEPAPLAAAGASSPEVIVPCHATAEVHTTPVTQMPGLNRQARRAIGRHSRIAGANVGRHIHPQASVLNGPD